MATTTNSLTSSDTVGDAHTPVGSLCLAEAYSNDGADAVAELHRSINGTYRPITDEQGNRISYNVKGENGANVDIAVDATTNIRWVLTKIASGTVTTNIKDV